jgi:hypothetical protein
MQDLARDMDLLGEAHQAQQANEQVSDIDFPPAQPVPGRARKGMMIVVPPFA